jgi:CDP-diacylglycerol--serine O-phosphatidyltransferase
MSISKSIPNIFTALNLIAGCIGLLAVYDDNLYHGALFILIGAIFDFLDGFLARLLNARSAIGKQLDSLADLITFGLLPAFLIYHLMEEFEIPVISYLSLLLVVSSAFRLAKFNIDNSQEVYFKGLPTPACAFLVAGLVFVKDTEWSVFTFIYDNLIGLTIFTLAISYLMNAPFIFLSFKVKQFRLQGNEYTILLILFSLVCIFFYGIQGIFPASLFYVLLSLFKNILIVKAVS